MKKREGKVFLIFISLFVLCSILFAGCTRKEPAKPEVPFGELIGKKLFPISSVTTLYCYDGETISCWDLWEDEKQEALIEEIAAVPARQVEDWSTKQLTYPIYGFQNGITLSEGNLRAAWSNGYLILEDGSAYQFDYDFSSVHFLNDYLEYTEHYYRDQK